MHLHQTAALLGPPSPEGTAWQGQRGRRISVLCLVLGAARLTVWSTSIPDVQQKWPWKRQVDCEFKRLLPAVHLISIFENNKVWLEPIWSISGKGGWKWCHRSPRCCLTPTSIKRENPCQSQGNKAHALAPSHLLEIVMRRQQGGQGQLCYYFLKILFY